MGKSKKPRKPYNPNKNITESPVLFRYSKAEADKLKLRYYFHLEHLLTEQACAGDYLSLDFRLKVGIGLCKLFEGSEASALIEKALKILEQIKLERIVKGSWTITQQTQKELRPALALIDDIHDQTTRAEQAKIYFEVEKKLEHHLYETLP